MSTLKGRSTSRKNEIDIHVDSTSTAAPEPSFFQRHKKAIIIALVIVGAIVAYIIMRSICSSSSSSNNNSQDPNAQQQQQKPGFFCNIVSAIGNFLHDLAAPFEWLGNNLTLLIALGCIALGLTALGKWFSRRSKTVEDYVDAELAVKEDGARVVQVGDSLILVDKDGNPLTDSKGDYLLANKSQAGEFIAERIANSSGTEYTPPTKFSTGTNTGTVTAEELKDQLKESENEGFDSEGKAVEVRAPVVVE